MPRHADKVAGAHTNDLLANLENLGDTLMAEGEWSLKWCLAADDREVEIAGGRGYRANQGVLGRLETGVGDVSPLELAAAQKGELPHGRVTYWYRINTASQYNEPPVNEHRFHNDSLARALAILGDRWTFLILREAFFGVRRYSQLARNLGLSRTILTDRLQRLSEHEILERRRYRQDPDRYEYVLTQRGQELYPAIVALLRWGDDHLAGQQGPPLILHHKTCGHSATPVLICQHCHEPIYPRDIQPEPGPGAYAKPRSRHLPRSSPKAASGAKASS